MGLRTNHKEAIEGIKRYSNLYGDTTLVSYECVKEVIDTCGEKKIMFGSDAIMLGKESYKKYMQIFERIKNEYGGAIAEDVFHNNCIRIFGGEKKWIVG